MELGDHDDIAARCTSGVDARRDPNLGPLALVVGVERICDKRYTIFSDDHRYGDADITIAVQDGEGQPYVHGRWRYAFIRRRCNVGTRLHRHRRFWRCFVDDWGVVGQQVLDEQRRTAKEDQGDQSGGDSHEEASQPRRCCPVLLLGEQTAHEGVHVDRWGNTFIMFAEE
jgi:hypothetical protein